MGKNGPEVAKAYVSIIPSMEGAQSQIKSELNMAADAAGNSAGKTAGNSLSNSLSKSMSNVGTKLTKTVTVPLAGIGAASFAAATKFETSFAKLSTIADTSQVPVDKLKKSIISLSNETGLGASEINDAAYSAISAGQSTKNALGFVESAAKLSKAGFTSIATSTDVLTTALNAYGMKASEVGHVSDVLITTQNLGKTTVDELASSMGKVIPTASAAGIGIEDLSSQYVALTKNGIATAEATTYINSMINELSKSGTEANLTFKKIAGETFKEYIESGHNTAEAMALLKKGCEDTGLSIADAFGSAEAGKAAQVLASHTSDATDALKQMETTSGQTEEAFGKMEKTTGASIEKMLTSITNLGIAIGQNLLPIAEPALIELKDVTESMSKAWSGLDPEAQKFIIKAGLVAIAIGPVLKAGSKVAPVFKGISTVFGELGKKAGDVVSPVTAAGSSMKTMAGNALQLIALGAGITLIGIGIKQIGDAATEVANAGPGAVATMFGIMGATTAMIAVISLVGPGLSVATPGLVAFGVAAVGVGAGIDLATTGTSRLVNSLSKLVLTVSTSAPGLVLIINSVGDSYVKVIDSITGGISGIFNSIGGIFKSMGTAALDAGKGMEHLAAGVKTVTKLNLLDVAASMGAVAIGIGKITSKSGEIKTTADSLSVIVNRMRTMDTASSRTASAMNGFSISLSNTGSKVKSTMSAMLSDVKTSLNLMQKTFSTTKFKLNTDIDLPHFSMSGSFNAKTKTVPDVKVRWYEKAAEQGAKFTKPQIIGVGDSADPEVLIGESKLKKLFSKAQNIPNIVINVYGYKGQDEKSLANEVAKILQKEIDSKEAVFA